MTDPARQLRPGIRRTDPLGHSRTTYQQFHEGIPVFSGVLHIHQDPAGRFRAANGRFFPIKARFSSTPNWTADQAERIARKHLHHPGAALETIELMIVDPGWYGDPPTGPRLAWHIILLDAPAGVREAFFIDAHTGHLLDRWDMICRACSRLIHDAAGSGALPGALVRSEGQTPVEISNADRAYDYAGDTYQYLYRAFQRDSLDGLGLPLVLTVNSTAAYCPNAFWNGQQVVLCDGMVADDIVAHELIHGLTQYTANLVYQNQPGQLNEAFSDIFGELVDLFNNHPEWPSHPSGPGTDFPNLPRSNCSPPPSYPGGYRWLIGEETAAGTLRDLWSPTCFYNPDRSNSPHQYCDPYDNGGVHSGSAIPGHAFAIMTDGKTFNGYTVNGIGPVKAGAVWYRALTTYLTPGSDFEDAYLALNQSAQDLIGTYPNDPRTGQPLSTPFTAQDAEEVNKALLAVEMNGPGRCGAIVPVLNSTPPVLCGPDRNIIFADDFEQGSGGWTVSNTNPVTPYDWELTTDPLPFGRPGRAWFCRASNIGDCITEIQSGAHYLTSPPIQTPPHSLDPTIMFTHYMASEPRYDGGNVKISINEGPWQLIPSSAFTYNAYNSTLYSYAGGNPLSGQPAWTGVGGEWGASLIRLDSLISGGETIRLRFELGKDDCYGVTGWYIDDFVVFTCPTNPPTAQDAVFRTPMDTPLNIALSAQDDGLPIPPGKLVYTLTSLPTSGTLTDPGAGPIAQAPYTLANHGNQVDYTPSDPAYEGPDWFTFVASDGGIPPQGGDSNTATVLIQVGPARYFTEHFDPVTAAEDRFDLAHRSLTLRPQEGLNGYAACLDAITQLPVDPTDHPALSLLDDDYQRVRLSGGNTVRLYGRPYPELFVCSNGYVVLDPDDDELCLIEFYENLESHFNAKRVVALFDDLSPPADGARVTFAELIDRAVATWINVPKYGTEQRSTFQIEMFFDGTIRISWLDVGSPDTLVGVSNGAGIPADYQETDFSYLRICQPGDFDHDGDVDQVDFGHLQLCLTGADIPLVDPACLNARMDGDDDIDSADMELFRLCLSGSNQPADPACAD